MTKPTLVTQLAGTKTRVSTDEAARETPAEPMYERLERKDLRLRDDQFAELTALARQVMRARTVKVERITENTLIRVAIDLLLAHSQRLRGNTEAELRKSVTPTHRTLGTQAFPDYGSPEVPAPRSPGPPVPGVTGAGQRAV